MPNGGVYRSSQLFQDQMGAITGHSHLHLPASQGVNTIHIPGCLEDPKDQGGYGSRFMAKIWENIHRKRMRVFW